MDADHISLLDGSTFMISDRMGDAHASPSQPEGLFHRDTRFLSKWELTINGECLMLLSTDVIDYFSAKFFLIPQGSDVYTNPTVSIVRSRLVSDGMHEDVTIHNDGNETFHATVTVAVESDFADIFEVKDVKQKQGRLSRRPDDGDLVLSYERDDFIRQTRVSSSVAPEVDSNGLTFVVSIEPKEQWSTCLEVIPEGADSAPLKYTHDHFKQPHPNLEVSLDEWLGSAPTLDSDWETLNRTYRKSLEDLASLRFYPDAQVHGSVPAGGLPWFMTLFGRDSLITCFQVIAFLPEMSATTLRTLAAAQAKTIDDFRDAEPGKILHEVRFGESAFFREQPQSPYYGTADATPLFLILLDEYERWSGDVQLTRELEHNARAAIDWIDNFGDRDGDGYVEYQRRNTDTGLINQCWKDSPDSIVWADGALADLPRATCEIQGYVYDAKVRTARLARTVWHDEAFAARLEAEAATLKQNFNRDYWMPQHGAFAVALDGNKRAVDCRTSNMGHLLWSGIVDDDKVDALVETLFGPAMFSGWGIRTLGADQAPFNPLGYHRGTVWPHDNSLIAAGLARYGFKAEAARIAAGMLDAAADFAYRLPEAFAGYDREYTHFPVQYPTASVPQAWSTAAPLSLMCTFLGLEPNGETLTHKALLPDVLSRISLTGIPGRWGRADVTI